MISTKRQQKNERTTKRYPQTGNVRVNEQQKLISEKRQPGNEQTTKGYLKKEQINTYNDIPWYITRALKQLLKKHEILVCTHYFQSPRLLLQAPFISPIFEGIHLQISLHM